MCSAFCAVGRAMLTIVASSTMSSCDTAITPSASQRLGSGPEATPGGATAAWFDVLSADVAVVDTVVPPKKGRAVSRPRRLETRPGERVEWLAGQQWQDDVVDQVVD